MPDCGYCTCTSPILAATYNTYLHVQPLPDNPGVSGARCAPSSLTLLSLLAHWLSVLTGSCLACPPCSPSLVAVTGSVGDNNMLVLSAPCMKVLLGWWPPPSLLCQASDYRPLQSMLPLCREVITNNAWPRCLPVLTWLLAYSPLTSLAFYAQTHIFMVHGLVSSCHFVFA